MPITKTTGQSPEEWRPVPGVSRDYKISTYGRVQNPAGRILRPSRASQLGYLKLSLPDINGVQRNRYVHSMLLEAFVGPRPSGHVARHLNGDHLDNQLSNLTWGTESENAQDRVIHGHDASARRTHCVNNHLLEGENVRRVGNKRICRTCTRINKQKSRARKAA